MTIYEIVRKVIQTRLEIRLQISLFILPIITLLVLLGVTPCNTKTLNTRYIRKYGG